MTPKVVMFTMDVGDKPAEQVDKKAEESKKYQN